MMKNNIVPVGTNNKMAVYYRSVVKEFPYIRPDWEKYETFDDGYYHFMKDLLLYPDAWVYAVWSKRGPGKTYSFLWFCYYNRIPFIYMKRNDSDVSLILRNDKRSEFDPSPYKPLKRDKHIKVIGVEEDPGIGAFYEADGEGNPIRLLCYVLSFKKVQKYKGHDFSDAEFICFDEFIAQNGERMYKSEGENLLDLYMTVRRDRMKRGRKSLKLVMFANAENIAVPATRELEIVDQMAELNFKTEMTHLYLEERKMMLHHITNDEIPITVDEMDDIYIGMAGTEWHDKAFGGLFTHNDFSNVTKRSLKGYKPIIQIIYKRHEYFILFNEDKSKYYMTSKPYKAHYIYDLSRENEQKRFYFEWVLDLREACIEERFKFEKYSMYDLILNYKKLFDVS